MVLLDMQGEKTKPLFFLFLNILNSNYSKITVYVIVMSYFKEQFKNEFETICKSLTYNSFPQSIVKVTLESHMCKYRGLEIVEFQMISLD